HGVARPPVQVDVDGDFALDDLLALPEVGPARRINAAPATLAALWQLHAADHAESTGGTQRGAVAMQAAPTEVDAVLLHRIEASGLFRPPVREQVAALTPDLGAAWLALAARWVDLSQSCGDLRFPQPGLQTHRCGLATPQPRRRRVAGAKPDRSGRRRRASAR
ncbi:MAG: hypothetical protein ACRDRH_28860, partial [Pseudonocardia sp.]